MDARSIADRSAIGRLVRFSGRRRHHIQVRSGFFVVADDSEDRIAIGEDRVLRRSLPAGNIVLINPESEKARARNFRWWLFRLDLTPTDWREHPVHAL